MSNRALCKLFSLSQFGMEILILSHEICQFKSSEQTLLVAGVQQNANREQL